MIMDEIQKKTKYIIIFLGVFILIGLTFIDGTGNSLIQPSNETDVVTVDGKSISVEQFQRTVEQSQLQSKRKGESLDGASSLNVRKKVYDQIISSAVSEKSAKDYGLSASPAEMWADLDNEPLPGADTDTTFYTNGKFDKKRYQIWLRKPEVLSSQMMRNVELQLKNEIIPQKQMLVYLGSFIKPTYLEANFNNYGTRVKSDYNLYKVHKDSVVFDSSLVTEKNLQEFYEINKGQFLFTEDAIELSYIKIEVQPSSLDSISSEETAEDISSQIKAGSSFDDMVSFYSDDQATIGKKGSLGDFRGKGFFVSKFEAVAFSLKKGEISKPVLTRYGWHIIRCDAIKGKGRKKKIKVSHILLKPQVGVETIDSVKQYVENLRQESLNEENILEFLVKKHPNEFQEVKGLRFDRWEFSPISGDFISGLHSFAFGNSEEGALSSTLPNEFSTSVYIFQKDQFFSTEEAYFVRAKDKVKEALIKSKKQKLAKQKLEKLLPRIKKQRIKKLAKNINGATYSSGKDINTKSWDFEIGYQQVAASAFLKIPLKQWGSVEVVDDGAIVAYPTKRNIKYSFLEYNEKNLLPEPFQLVGLGVLSYNFNNNQKQKLNIENKFDLALNN